MKIEEGRFYRTRDGRKVGPMVREDEYNSMWPWTVGHEFSVAGVFGKAWKSNGSYSGDLSDEADPKPGDLVCEWTDEPTSPVRERVVKEIVPGTYGRFFITGTYQGYRVKMDWSEGVPFVGMNAQELREAAKIFTDLAEYLESKDNRYNR